MRDQQLHKIFSTAPNYRPEYFFSTPELSQRLSLIRHLLQHSEQLLLLVAEKGSGKTYLLEQLRGQPDKQWHLFYIKGDSTLPEQSVLQQLLNSLSINTDGKNRDDLRNSLRSHLAALRYNGELPVLLVEDANMLPLDSLQLLIDMSMRGETQTRLRVLLSCEPQITSLFSTPEFAIMQQTLIHTVDIPQFSAEQANVYLDFRLKQGHYVGDLAFTEIQRHQFYQQSRGLPAGLNQAVLQHCKPKIKAKTQTKPDKRKPVIVIVGFIILLALLNWLKGVWLPNSHPVIQELPTPISISPRYIPDVTLENSNIHAMLPITDPVVEQNKIPSKKADISPETLPKKSADMSVDSLNSSGIKGVQSTEWLSRQPPDFYSIQIIGAHEKNTLEKLLKQQKLDPRVPVAMFKTRRDQRIWYVLTYGIYKDADMAKQALQTLPQSLQNTGPWIRPLVDIHLLIEQQALSNDNR